LILAEIQQLAGVDVKQLFDIGLISTDHARKWIIRRKYYQLAKTGRTYADIKNELSDEYEGLFMVPFSHFEYYSPSYFGLTENKINDLLIDSKDRLWIAGSDDMIQMDTRDPGDYKFLNKHQMFTTFQRIWNRLPLPADIIDPFFFKRE
jgi:hypothetical protein